MLEEKIKEKMLAVTVPPNIRLRIKAACEITNITMKCFVTRAIVKELIEFESKQQKEKR